MKRIQRNKEKRNNRIIFDRVKSDEKNTVKKNVAKIDCFENNVTNRDFKLKLSEK